MSRNEAVEGEILACLSERDEGASACPSEIARRLADAQGRPWRSWMNAVREVAADLARRDRIMITRGARVLSPQDLRGGPIRLRRGSRFVGRPS